MATIRIIWKIVHKDKPYLTWSNEEGWGTGRRHHTNYSQHEKDTLDLPIDGRWESNGIYIMGGETMPPVDYHRRCRT